MRGVHTLRTNAYQTVSTNAPRSLRREQQRRAHFRLTQEQCTCHICSQIEVGGVQGPRLTFQLHKAASVTSYTSVVHLKTLPLMGPVLG